MVWCLGTTATGEEIEFGYPLSVPLSDALHDLRYYFVSIEILSVEKDNEQL